MSNIIAIHPSNLVNAGSSLKIRVSDIDNALSTITSATNGASSALSASSVLAPAAVELEEALGGIKTVTQCLEDVLIRVGTGLANTAAGFETTDKTLADMFNRIDASLLSYTGFEEQTIPAPAAPANKTHHSWWQTALKVTGVVGLGLAGAVAEVAGGGPEDPLGDVVATGLVRAAYGLAA